MTTIYRVCKSRYPVFDGSGASLVGGRWNSPGRPVVYASTCMAGSLLEILAHVGPRLHLPGRHHGARAHVPDEVPQERLEAGRLFGWNAPESASARAFGDQWLREARTAVLVVPALTAQPFAEHVLLNPRHSDFRRIEFEAPQSVEWDARLLGA